MTITVHLFARARDLAGRDSLPLELHDGATVAELRNALRTGFPRLAALVDRSAVAVNDEFGADDLIIPPGAAVALLPPVSGG